MILDEIQADYDLNEVHSIQVKASAQVVFDCIKEIAPSEIARVMRLLVWLRTLPERLAGRQKTWLGREEPLLSQMASGNFTILAENASGEIVLGMLVPGKIGRVWQKNSDLNVRCADVQDYLAFDQPEYIRVVMNLLVENTERPGYVSIRTESRCRALSRRALRDFTPYWRLIRPFSGLIRIVWLRGIKRKAEKQMIPVSPPEQ
jgi:hypothetical protein